MTIDQKCRVAATILLAFLVLFELRKRSYEHASARFVGAVDGALLADARTLVHSASHGENHRPIQ